MKCRFDFVTNSSSSSFVVRIGVKLKDGEELKYEAFAEDDGGGCDYGEVQVDRNLFDKAVGAKDLNDLIAILEQSVSYTYAEEDACVATDHRFDKKDFELYKKLKNNSYTRNDFLETDCGFYETDDDLGDGRSVPYSKGIVIFDKAVRKKAKSLEDIKSIIIESERTASGEFIERDDFPGLDWSEYGDCAECLSVREMDLKTQEINEKTESKWD